MMTFVDFVTELVFAFVLDSMLEACLDCEKYLWLERLERLFKWKSSLVK